jgi:hypothetical protein
MQKRTGQEVGHGAFADGRTEGKVRPDWTGSIHESLGGLIMARTTLANARCRKFPGPLSREGLTLSRVSPYHSYRTILADHVVVRLNRSSR